MSEILLPILILGGAAVLCAVLLTVAAVFLSVKENEKFAPVRDCLPGANCGACGYSGCDSYASALAEGKEQKTNLCVPGGDVAAKSIADVLGVSAEDVVEKVAYVACSGTCSGDETRKFIYDGPKNCKAANMYYQGDRFCSYACLGYGDCAAVCPRGAISVKNGIAHVEPSLCIGCGICERECPNHIIKVVPDTVRVTVNCSNHDMGALVRKTCIKGCIGCGKCVKTCPEGAISLDNNLAKIDYDKCVGCGKCHEACPVGAIHTGNFRCAAHEE